MLQPVDRMPTAPAIPPISVGASLAQAGAAVGKVAGDIGKSAGGSGGYVFSPEEIDAVITQWQGLLDDLMEDEFKARDIAGVEPPGLEFASQDFVDVAGPSGKMLHQQIMRMQQYVSDYITALKEAKGATQTTDENAATQANNAAGDA